MQQMTNEQIEALQEKIKDMSPEELKEFQKKQCIFCQIVEGKIKAKKIYEDDKCIAILDINPAAPGHVLLLPKEHYTVMPQLPEDELAHIFMAAKSLSNAILRSLDARGTNIVVANGPAAGQKAQHFMVHIIPRKENDDIQLVLPQKKIDEKDLRDIKEKIYGKMMEGFGAKKHAEKKAKKEAAKEEEKTPAGQKPSEKNLQKAGKPGRKPKPGKDKPGMELDDIAKILGVK